MLDHLFNLVSYRAFYWQAALILLTSFAFADFTSSDSAVLSAISSDVEDIKYDVSSSAGYLSNIESDTVQIIHLQESTFNRLVNVHSSVDRAVSLLGQVTNSLKAINGKLTVQTISHNDQNDSFNTVLVHDPRTDDIYHIGEDVYNTEVDIYNRLGVLNDSINNLTNFLCYSPEYVTGVTGFYTNLAALASATYISDESMRDIDKLKLYILITGNTNATQKEANDFFALYTSYGGTGSFIQEVLSRLYCDPLAFSVYDGSSFEDMLVALYDQLGSYTNPFFPDLLQIGEMNYYQYGTRQLTDTTISISNTVSNLTQMVSAFYSNSFDSVTGEYVRAAAINEALTRPVEYDGSTQKAKNSPIVLNVAGELAEDTLETLPIVSTNIVAANTNAISNLQDNDYNAAINNLKNATPDTLPNEFDQILTDLNSEEFTQGLVDVLSESTEECIFTFDLSGFNLIPPSRNTDISQGLINLTVQDVKQITNDYVHFFCSFIECFLVLFFGSLLWNLIYTSGTSLYK